MSTTIPAPPDSVYAALLPVYRDLGIQVKRADPAGRLVANDLFKARRKLAGTAMQRYMDCGGEVSQPNAELFDMELGIVTVVYAAVNGGSVVTSTLTGSGSDPMFGRDRQMQCVSTGEFERRIATAVRAKVAPKR